MIEVAVFPSPAALAEGAAELFVRSAARAIVERGRFVVALSGGSTPRAMHAELVRRRDEVAWSQVHVILGDDRYVEPSDPQSNEGMVRSTLATLVPIPEENLHFPYRPGGPEEAALAYERTLHALAGEDRPWLDLLYLGLGEDGHTASLFPGEPGVYERERWVLPARAPVNAAERVTLTPPALVPARQIAFLVSGEAKRPAALRCLEGPEDWDATPSQAIARHAERVLWLTDLE